MRLTNLLCLTGIDMTLSGWEGALAWHRYGTSIYAALEFKKHREEAHGTDHD